MNPFKKYKNNKKSAQINLPKSPRSKEEIEKNYSQLMAEIGQTQYRLFVHTEQLKQMNMAMVELHQENARRGELDAAEAAKQAAKEPKQESANV